MRILLEVIENQPVTLIRHYVNQVSIGRFPIGVNFRIIPSTLVLRRKCALRSQMDMPDPIARVSTKIRMMALFNPIAEGFYELIPQRYLGRISLVELIIEYTMNGDAIHATATTLLWGVPVDEKLSPSLRDGSRLFNANPRNGGRILTCIRFGCLRAYAKPRL